MQENHYCSTSLEEEGEWITWGNDRRIWRSELCELVGSFLLYALSLKYYKTNIGLYRNEGSAIFKNVSRSHCEKIRKEFQQLFRQDGLKLIVKSNLKIVDFLDLTLNYTTDSTCKPYRKPNDENCYIHKESNHPPSITKQMQISIETRFSELSSNKKVFNESVLIYQESLINLVLTIN